MDPSKISKFFVAAMKQLTAGTKAEDFAGNYANAGGSKDSSSIWQQNYNEGLKQFSLMDQNKDGIIDENEFKLVGTYVEIQKDKDGTLAKMVPSNIEEMTGNSLIADARIKGGTEKDTPELIPEKSSGTPEKSSDIPQKTSDTAPKKEIEAEEPAENGKTKPIPEQMHLKPIDAMSRDEIIAEIQKYDKDFSANENAKENILKKTLVTFRSENNETDENSDIVDMHIGTFNQGALGSCTLLSQLCGLSDDDMKKIVQEKSDDSGTYYEVTFPMDSKDDSKKVRVSLEELQNERIVIHENGKDYPVTSFSKGDEDVKLMEMAFIKRFGINGFIQGIHTVNIQNIFSYPDEPQAERTQSIIEDKLKSTSRATLTMKDYTLLDDDFSYLNRFTSESGISAEWSIEKNERRKCETVLKELGVDTSGYENLSDAEFLDETEKYLSDKYNFVGILTLSNGLTVSENHAYALKSYNPDTKEVTIADPHQNNEDIVLPYDIAEKYLSISF